MKKALVGTKPLENLIHRNVFILAPFNKLSKKKNTAKGQNPKRYFPCVF